MNFLIGIFRIKKVERGYLVRGRHSVHKTKRKALKQLKGMRDAH